MKIIYFILKKIDLLVCSLYYIKYQILTMIKNKKKYEKFKKFMQNKNKKINQQIKKVSVDIFNVNSKLFIKQYLLVIINKPKYNSEIISLVKKSIFNVKNRILFYNNNYDENYKQIIRNIKNKNTNKSDLISVMDYVINNNYDKFFRFIMNNILSLNGILSFREMCVRAPELFSNVNSWYIYGCPLSTDLDISVVVSRKLNGTPVCPNYNSIRKLFNSIKTHKIMDFNFITIDIDEKRITSVKKGHDELVNIINETYKYHVQQHPLVNLNSIQTDYLNKMRSISKLILDNLEQITDNYKEKREAKKRAYCAGTFEMIEFSIECFDNIVFVDDKFRKDFLKKLVIKIIQIILSKDDIYHYTKKGLATLISEKYDNKLYEQHSLYYLLRGNEGIENYSFIDFMFNEYKNIYIEYKKVFDERINIMIPKNELLEMNIPGLSTELFEYFLESPIKLQNNFKNKYLELYPDASINQICKPEQTLNEDFIDFLVRNNLRDKFYFVPQRSSEWFELLNYHICGKNSVVIKSELEDRYHLLRGIIGEYIIQNKINKIIYDVFGENDYQFIEVGMIVESKEYSSMGVSPDGLLYSKSKNDIIIIEIKCLKHENVGGNYLRELSLSKLQLNKAQDIMTSGTDADCVRAKISILSWFKNKEMCLDVFVTF
jgi:hypothetical protein